MVDSFFTPFLTLLLSEIRASFMKLFVDVACKQVYYCCMTSDCLMCNIFLAQALSSKLYSINIVQT